jgi:hypothetical protein
MMVMMTGFVSVASLGTRISECHFRRMRNEALNIFMVSVCFSLVSWAPFVRDGEVLPKDWHKGPFFSWIGSQYVTCGAFNSDSTGSQVWGRVPPALCVLIWLPLSYRIPIIGAGPLSHPPLHIFSNKSAYLYDKKNRHKDNATAVSHKTDLDYFMTRVLPSSLLPVSGLQSKAQCFWPVK